MYFSLIIMPTLKWRVQCHWCVLCYKVDTLCVVWEWSLELASVDGIKGLPIHVHMGWCFSWMRGIWLMCVCGQLSTHFKVGVQHQLFKSSPCKISIMTIIICLERQDRWNRISIIAHLRWEWCWQGSQWGGVLVAGIPPLQELEEEHSYRQGAG